MVRARLGRRFVAEAQSRSIRQRSAWPVRARWVVSGEWWYWWVTGGWLVCGCLRSMSSQAHPPAVPSQSLCPGRWHVKARIQQPPALDPLGFPFIVSFRSHPYPYPYPGPPQTVLTNWPGRRPGSASTSDLIAERPHDGGRVSAAAACSTKTSPVLRPVSIISLPSTAFA